MDGDAIDAADTKNMDFIAKEHASRTLFASGTAVGLSDGLMGNSEVGYVSDSTHNVCASFVLFRHLNIGAGRVVWQDIVRIDVSIKKRQFHNNKVILDSCKNAKESTGRLHLIGLVSQNPTLC